MQFRLIRIFAKVFIFLFFLRICYKCVKRLSFYLNDESGLFIGFEHKLQSGVQHGNSRERSFPPKFKLAKQFQCNIMNDYLRTKWVTMLRNISMNCNNNTHCNNVTERKKDNIQAPSGIKEDVAINKIRMNKTEGLAAENHTLIQSADKKVKTIGNYIVTKDNNNDLTINKTQEDSHTKNSSHIDTNPKETAINKGNFIAQNITTNVSFASKVEGNETQNRTTGNAELQYCPDIPKNLGPLTDTRMTKQNYLDMLKQIEIGGAHNPRNCKPRHHVYIIVPYVYKSKLKHAFVRFLHIIHPFLIQQQISYRIYVIEQSLHRKQQFSPGALMNIGFQVVQNMTGNTSGCFIFHSPQMLPMDTRNLYRCTWYPRQLISIADQDAYSVNVLKNKKRSNKKLIVGINETVAIVKNEEYHTLKLRSPRLIVFGHAIAINSVQFIDVNGFSNILRKKDDEYNDFYKRLTTNSYFIERPPSQISQYIEVETGFEERNYSLNQNLDPEWKELYWKIDGLSSVSYKVESIENKPKYTLITIDSPDIQTNDNFVDSVQKMLSTQDPSTAQVHKY